MKRRYVTKKIGSLALALAMIVTSFPVFSEKVQATEAKTSGTGPSVTAFAEKDQLMTVFKPDENGNSDTIGKLAFGKNEGNEVQNWYILGKDEGVDGANTVLFAAGPIRAKVFFDPSMKDQTYTPAANTGYTDTSSVTVYANHYGASMLYGEAEGSTNYFAEVEQGLMNETTVKTNDSKNNVDYTTTARLYALTADDRDASYIKAGSSDQIVLAKEKYWNSGSDFWLRAPLTSQGSSQGSYALLARPGKGVSSTVVGVTNALVPAFSLNLSSVLFASAAEASSSETAVAGTIADGTAMTLRLDGTGKAIGTVIYDEAAGKIEAKKDANATGTVSLVVQGNDGTNDWYYSVQAGETTVVTEEQIKTACSLSGEIDLADCKIWLETPAENGRVAYATKMAKTRKTIDAVALTGVKPAGGSAFPVKASCGTEGVDANSLAVTYTAKDTSGAATGTAGWNTAYQAGLTLAAVDLGSTFYVFRNPVSVTVDGETAQNVSPNADGTLTVTKDFTTAKRKITGISAPAVPSSEVFASYYTAKNVLSDTNRELGKTATLTLEGSASPNTVNADVVWTLANSGSTAYNAAPGAGNTFRWAIAADQIKEYDASGCAGYDRETGTVSGTVTISNKAVTPVTIDGDNKTLNFDGSAIDVSKYFTIDTNAGTRSYSLVQDTGVTGEGSLSGALLTVTKPGVFQIKLTTAANGNYAAGEKTITLTVNYSSGAVTLAPGKTVVREDETVTNGSDGTVTIDKGNNGTVDVTVKLPQTCSVNIDAEGKVTVPANGTVQATDGKELTLPEGGKVDKAGNVEAAKIVSGDVTVMAPSGGKVTANKAGSIMVPAGGTVQAGDGKELTLPEGGSVDKDGNVEAGKITVGDTTVTAPEGKKVTVDKAGTITAPAGGKVETGDGKVMTLSDGGTVDKDGNVEAGKITVGDTTVTAPDGEKVTADEEGNITVPARGTVQTGNGEEMILPEGGSVDKDGNVEAGKITVGDTTVTLPGGKVETDEVGNITVPAGGTIQSGDGQEITLPSGGTVDKNGNVEAGKITFGDTTVTAPEGGKVETDEVGNIIVPAEGTIQSGDGQEITLPSGGTVDKNGNVEAGKITVGDTTVTAPEGGKVTADKEGNITIPAGGTVQTGNGEEMILPDGGMVDQDGNITEQSFDGSGTLEDPYQIKTEEDLKKLAELVNSGKDAKKAYYKIEAEEGIALTEGSSPWTPIGTAEHPFTGTIDGNGKAIKGLEISGDEPKDSQGLFGVNAGTIKNLTVEGSVTGKVNVGGIAGTNNGIIKDCTADVSVTGQDNVGGITGKNDGTITGCTNKGSVTGKVNVGGIAGTNGETGKVNDNVNSGDVVGDITGSSPTPGVATPSPTPGESTPSPTPGEATPSPTPGVATPSPTPGEATPSPTPGVATPSPTPGVATPSPTPGESTPSPTPGESTPSPTPGGSTPSPTPGESTPSPTPGGATPSPTPGEATPSPTPGESTPSPTPEGNTPSPTPGEATPSPVPEQQKEVNQIAKELNVPVETAKKLQEMAQELGIETDTLLLTNQDIVNWDSEGDVKGSAFSKLRAKATKAKKNSITLKWNKVKGASGYQIYAAKCGKNKKYKLVKTIKKASTTSFTYKKLKKGTGYKFIVKAYKNIDGKKYTVAASKTVHEVTEGGKSTNPKSVKVNKNTVKIKNGKKFKIKSKIVKASSGKKLANHRKLSYESTNKEIATVSKKGVIKGKKAGTCYIYIYAENGIYKKIKVTVKK